MTVLMIPFQVMSDALRKTLACGCHVETARDFLQRVVGTIVVRGDACQDAQHVPGKVVIMPGRENARPD
jgi:hypothetical protein